MQELIDELKKITRIKSDNAYVTINNKQHIIDKKNFHDIDEKNGNIVFIDGGQTMLFESSGFCLGFIRTAAIEYENNKRTSRAINEFYVFISRNNNRYHVKTFPKNEFDDKEFDENSIIFNEKSFSGILQIIRRLAELSLASKYDNVVLDGSLEAKYDFEKEYAKNLKSDASALSKTSTLTINNGLSLTEYLRSLNNSRWYYAVDKTNYFVKLNDKSDYVFRLEANNPEIIGILAKNSTDPVFLGYPYGLIDADASARVSDDEKKMLQTTISVKLGKQWNEFSKHLKSTNAHEILDKIRF